MHDGANPAVKTTIVNVKGVEVEAWEMAKDLSNRHDESLGSVVSRAIRQLHQIDRGPRELPPLVSANLIPKTANPDDDGLVALLNAAAAIAASNERKLSSVPGLTSLVAERVRAARGLPPLAPRRLRGAQRLIAEAAE